MIGDNNLEIKRSKLNGSGVFAKKQFRSGEQIFQVKGRLYTKQEIYALAGGKFADNTFRFAKDYFISPEGELGDFLNHSCNPNSGVKKINNTLIVAAIKDIHIGEEITMDYSTILTDDDVYELDCNCGNSKCRNRIKGFSSLPQNIKEEYIHLGIVPEYILNQ